MQLYRSTETADRDWTMRSTSPPISPYAPFFFSSCISPSLTASLCQKWPHSRWAVLAAVSEGLGARCMQCQYDHSQCKLHPQSLASDTHTHTQANKALTDAACANTGLRFIPTGKGKYLRKVKILPLPSINFPPHTLLLLHLHFKLCITALHH